MIHPVRLQLSRRRGFNLQRLSFEINGLPARSVARPSLYGNLYVVGRDGSARECVAKFRASLKRTPPVDAVLDDLRGRNLACWCDLDAKWCHADVWLKITNA